ncbi:MAG: vancomycin resistance protein [Epsilonproteobacteria bacterium]|nr:vancomycin resistance protein [Campylobacterota bacterium]
MFKKIFKALLTAIGGIIFLIFIWDLWVEGISAKRIYKNIYKVPKRDVAVVLGTAKYIKKGILNPYYIGRIEAAVKLYKAKKIKAILVSGDNSTKYYNEPVRMRNDLIKRGVPSSRIYLDYAGFRTLDSIMRAQKIFGLKKYIIVSQEFHLKRAILIANATGANAIGFAAKGSKNFIANFKMRLREYLARFKAFLDLYILKTKPKFFGEYEKIPIKENRDDKR